MKRRSPMPRSIRRTAGAAISTGEHCPATGWWIPQGSTEPWRYLSEGRVMPALNGEPTVWLRAATDKNARNSLKAADHPMPLERLKQDC